MKAWFVFAGILIALGIAILWGYDSYKKSNEREAIVRVLKRSTNINNKIEKEIDPNNPEIAIRKYSRIISNIYLNGCPTNFVIAFRAYQAAWRDMADVMHEFENLKDRYASNGAVFENCLRTILGDFSMVNECNNDLKCVSSNIESAKKNLLKTWIEMLNVADDHGVDTTPYRKSLK